MNSDNKAETGGLEKKIPNPHYNPSIPSSKVSVVKTTEYDGKLTRYTSYYPNTKYLKKP